MKKSLVAFHKSVEKIRKQDQQGAKSACRTSCIVGMEGAAPWRDTARDDATEAIRSASSGSCPEVTAVRKKPVKVSPAAVVSTTGTL